ncbi:MAG: tetratricopeptide repeat protein [Candidatus Heimdallarchaeaceae archaeon]
MKEAAAHWCHNLMVKSIQKGKYRVAVFFGSLAYVISPSEVNLLNLLYLSFYNKNYRRAKKLLNIIIERNPHAKKFIRLLGLVYRELGEYEKSISIFLRNLKENEESVEDLYLLGKTYELKGDLKLAKKYYQSILDIDATFAKAFFRLADIYLEERSYEKAAKLLLEGLEIESGSTLNWIKLAYCYMKLNKTDVAEKILLRLYETKKEIEREALLLLLLCQIKLKKHVQVRQGFDILKKKLDKKFLQDFRPLVKMLETEINKFA